MASKPPAKTPPTAAGAGGQNVTLHLPKELIRRAKSVAARQGLSLSKYFAQGMERILRNEDEYEKAYRGWKDDMKQVRDRGGSTISSREELYDR